MNDKNNPFGLIGLAVMGQNLALNVESRGFAVSVFNRSPEATREFVAAHAGKRFLGCESLRDFVASDLLRVAVLVAFPAISLFVLRL